MAMCKKCRTFMFGVGLGAAAGVLLAPKSGKAMRTELFGGGGLDVMEEPGAEAMGPAARPEAAEDLKAKIEEANRQ